MKKDSLSEATQNQKTKKRVHYSNFNCPEEGMTFIQGIRGVEGSDDVYIAGSLLKKSGIMIGLLYEGPLAYNGSEGKWHELSYPSIGVGKVVNTSCYGPNNLAGNNVQIVGSYKVAENPNTMGFLYEGPVDGTGRWTTISPNNGDTKMVFVHSIMGGFAVGNYDTKVSNGFAFIYDINLKEFFEIAVEGAHSTTLYGIWHNGGTSYTMAGGCSLEGFGEISQGFIVDWDSETKETSNWKMYQYLDQNIKSVVTHFEGITGDGNGAYNLPCDWLAIESGNPIPLDNGGAFVKIQRNADGSFSDAEWLPLNFPIKGASLSANTAYKNNILGVYFLSDSNGTKQTFAYNAKVT